MKDPGRRGRVTARWLQRWLDAFGDATIDDTALAVASLQALGGRHHTTAVSTLRLLADEADRTRPARRRP
ncbi:MAG TPA: hypothetical protein VF094_12220 [Gaiellaceae bacterium]